MKIVFATHNKNKFNEVATLLPKGIELLSLEDIGCTEDIPETANTIEGNAIQKADYVTQKYGYNCFSDDTGLLVNVLDGAPGIYSARYAGEQKNAESNMQKLLQNLNEKDDRSAHFKTAIALNIDNTTIVFEGKVEGTITTEKRGKKGFGYDPVFLPNGYDKTFAELPLDIKNKIGHRGKAIMKLMNHIKTRT